MKALSRTLAIALEVVGCSVIVAGISVELYTGAPIGYVVISCGCVAIAAGGMIFTKLIRSKK
ncbi:MAG: histidine kinase [Desulfobacterales bacterium]|nr:histidine kinase [Desulfobacterales bacterium]